VGRRVDHTVTSFAHDGALVLEIDGSEYEVSTATAQYAVNAIPQASCVVATGRDLRNLARKAKIHDTARNLRQQRPMKLWIEPRGQYDATGKAWPNKRKLLFEGHYCGMSNRRSSGSIGTVLHFKHWLLDLAASSALAGGLAAGFPFSLVGPAVGVAKAGATQQTSANISEHVQYDILTPQIDSDVWLAIKALMVETCLERRMAFTTPTTGVSEDDTLRENTIALAALDRIEGIYSSETDGKDHGIEYDASAPITLSTTARSLAVIAEEIALFIGGQPLSGYAANSLWNILILQLLGPLGLVLVPTPTKAYIDVDRSLLSAAYALGSIRPNLILDLDDTAMLDVPVRAVGVYGNTDCAGGTADGLNGTPAPIFGGFYVDESLPEGTGTLLTAPMPFWMRRIAVSGQYAKTNLGEGGKAIRTAVQPDVAPAAGKPPPAKLVKDAQDLVNNYAQMVWANNALRGMDGGWMGPLRLDRAPGQLVRISKDSVENAAVDDLAVDQLGYLYSVTVTVDAQGRQAGEVYRCSHLRTEADNDRGMALDKHPLYDVAARVSPPLVEGFSNQADIANRIQPKS
jgi:hypothetical protein